jgi:hypothetical protein
LGIFALQGNFFEGIHEMSLPIFVGIGAGLGAVFGAAGYMAKGKLKPSKKSSPATSAITSTTSTPAVTTATTTNLKSSARQLFGADVRYLLPSSEFYTMLVRFENYLQFATEREALKSAVEHIDNFVGMEALLHGRNPIAKAALPTLAESARRKILQILNDMIEFSNEERPSATKKEAMAAIKDEINQAMLAIVKDMNRALAALPMYTKQK